MSINNTSRQVKTVQGQRRVEEMVYKRQRHVELVNTMNAKYGIFPNETLSEYAGVKYFGIGIQGCRNLDDGFRSTPNEVLSTNGDLYTRIPFRIVPVEQDLSPSERSQYRHRTVRQWKDGNHYVYYYLKAIEFQSTKVELIYKDPLTGLEAEYVLDPSNLSPSPPIPPTDGVIDNISNTVKSVVRATLQVLGTEMVEVINHLYDGDLRYAKLSEIGLFCGEDKVVETYDYTQTKFNYTEAISVELAEHYTFLGSDLSRTGSSYVQPIRFLTSEIMFQ